MELRVADEKKRREDDFREVDNPYRILGETQTKKQLVAVNNFQTPVEMMFARKQINEDEKTAADLFRMHCERVRIGGKVSDPSATPSKGSVSDPIMAMSIDSLRKLRQARRILGDIDYWLLEQAVGVGVSIADLTRQLYRTDKETKRKRFQKEAFHIGKRVKEALGNLVSCDWALPIGAAKGTPATPRFYRSFAFLTADIEQEE